MGCFFRQGLLCGYSFHVLSLFFIMPAADMHFVDPNPSHWPLPSLTGGLFTTDIKRAVLCPAAWRQNKVYTSNPFLMQVKKMDLNTGNWKYRTIQVIIVAWGWNATSSSWTRSVRCILRSNSSFPPSGWWLYGTATVMERAFLCGCKSSSGSSAGKPGHHSQSWNPWSTDPRFGHPK